MKRSSVIIALEICAIAALFVSWSFQRPNSRQVTAGNASEHFIRWVDFDVTADAMTQAFRYDVDTCQQDLHLNWVDLLAYLGARYGGDFSHYQASDMTEAAEQLQNGVTVEELTKNMTSFAYYREAYGAVLDGMVGLYEIEIPKSEAPAFALADAQIQGSGCQYFLRNDTTTNNWYRHNRLSQSSFTRNFSLIQHTNFSRTPSPHSLRSRRCPLDSLR